MSKNLILQNPIANKIEAENMPEILWLAKSIYEHETDELTKRDSDCRKLAKFIERIFSGIRYIDTGFLEGVVKGYLPLIKAGGIYVIPSLIVPIWRIIIENKIDMAKITNDYPPIEKVHSYLNGLENLQKVIQNKELEIIIRT